MAANEMSGAMSLSGVLSKYGLIKVIIGQNKGTVELGNGVSTVCWIVSKEEARLAWNAIRSTNGELTVADFYPEKVEELLNKFMNNAARLWGNIERSTIKKVQ